MNRHKRRKTDAYQAGKSGNHCGSKKGYHKGCFGKSHAERDGYKPVRFKKDFTIDRRYS